MCQTELHLLIALLQHSTKLSTLLVEKTADHFMQIWDALIQMLVNVMGLCGIVAISICDSISISINNIRVSTTKRRNRTAQPQPLIAKIPAPCSVGPVIGKT